MTQTKPSQSNQPVIEEGARFDYFHEAAAPAGGEGWESMYPFYLVPSDETREHDDNSFWFADTMH